MATHKKIQIGCHCNSIAKWLKIYPEIGAEEDYSSAEIEEYGLYIKLCAARYQPELLEAK